MTALILCFAVIFSSTVIPASAYAQPDASVESISIHEQSGVLEGEVLQLYASIESSSTFFDSVEWSSSNPQAISCTKDGKIEGLVAGKSATITCKAKYGSAKDSITVYCVKELSSQFKSNLKYFLTIVYSQPGTGLKDFCIDLPTLFGPLYQVFYMFSFITSVNSFINGKVTVCGKSGSYAYIRYGENNLLDGFVKNSSLKNTGNAFLTLSSTDMNVWADGVTYESRKLTTKYKGDVEWIYDDKSDYFEFDETTGQVIGKVPGKNVTITAKADGETATCTIHLLYKWKQAWTGKTNRKTNLYYAVGNGYSKGSTSLPTGTEFVVEGDCGTSNGWAYGYYQIGETKFWGYIPISHISTKGTVSQYNLMTTTITDENGKEKEIPWVWPMYDESIKNISSPYGPRNITASGTIHHRGYDITTGVSGDIAGEYVVASSSGTVTKIHKNNTDCGFAVSISTDGIDPITNKNISIIYMHLLENPKYENGVYVSVGDHITAGTIIGKVGKTNGNTDPDMGYHLHFEANSQNAAVGNDGRDNFIYTLNPMYFFVDKEVTFSNTNSYKKYGGYWYDLNGGYQNEEIFKSYFNF